MYCYLKNQCDSHVYLGEGSSGVVKLAMNVITKELVAIKNVFKKSTTSELAIHKDLKHPNIVQLVDFQVDTANRKTSLILEYADDGTLEEKIREHILDRSQIRSIFRQVCQTVRYLHQRYIIHGDLKPENILLTKQKKVKVCDFGSASLFGLSKPNSGTLEYMPPEVVLNIERNEKVDIWALGILLFEMISGQAPFKGNTKEQIVASMKQNIPFSQEFDLAEIELIKMILRVGISRRPDINTILKHRYFASCSSDKSVSGVSTVGSRQNDELIHTKIRKGSTSILNEQSKLGLFSTRIQDVSKIRRQFRIQSHELSEISKLL